MLKQSSILLAGLIICGCAPDRSGDDWATDCKRNFSETSREYAACIAAKSTTTMPASQTMPMTPSAQAARNAPAVTTTPEGSTVPYLEGKSISSDRDSTDGGA